MLYLGGVLCKSGQGFFDVVLEVIIKEFRILSGLFREAQPTSLEYPLNRHPPFCCVNVSQYVNCTHVTGTEESLLITQNDSECLCLTVVNTFSHLRQTFR